MDKKETKTKRSDTLDKKDDSKKETKSLKSSFGKKISEKA